MAFKQNTKIKDCIFSENNQPVTDYLITIFCIIFYLPNLFQMISCVCISAKKSQLKRKVLGPCFIVNILQVIFLILYLSTNLESALMPHTHFAGIVVFIAWLSVAIKLGDFPRNSVVIQMCMTSMMVSAVGYSFFSHKYKIFFVILFLFRTWQDFLL